MRFLLSLLSVFVLCLPAMATTVAYDGKSLAADTQLTYGHLSIEVESKVFYSPERQMWIGMAGNAEVLEKIRRWFLLSKKPTSDIKGSFTVLLIDKDGHCFVFDDDMSKCVIIRGPYAIGSGSEFAMGAMLAGKSAKEAVEIASKLDIFTNSQVVSLPIK